MEMKACLRLLVAAMLFAVPAHAPKAQPADWPRKSVRIVVPFPGGGSNDTLCRIVADKLSITWKQPVFVDNKTGAGGNIGAEIAYNAPGDGYTLLCAPPPPLAINHNLYKTLPYDWSKFVPITILALTPNVITARKDLPADSAQELIAYAKANPGKVTYASQGNGSTSHLTAQMFATMAGVDMVHVPFRGEGPALIELMGGRVDLFFGNSASVLKYHESKQVKLLG